MYGDTAQKTAERNDYSVFQLWGLGEDKRIYLLDMIRGKWEAPELKRRAIDFWNAHRAYDHKVSAPIRQMKIEDKSSGTGLIQDIARGGAGQGRIPVTGIARVTDKLTRVMDVVSYIDAGWVVIPEQAGWVKDFVAECEAFSADGTHAHDDQIDPMVDAINDLLAHPASDWSRWV